MAVDNQLSCEFQRRSNAQYEIELYVFPSHSLICAALYCVYAVLVLMLYWN